MEKTSGAEASWALDGMARDERSITGDWQTANQRQIDGVAVREVKNVPTGYGYLTEIFRQDWGLDDFGVDQVFQAVLDPGAVSAWHAHAVTTDRLFAAYGRLMIVLYDSREDSPTFGTINKFRAGTVRPSLLVVPPKVWHGIKNVAPTPSILVNVVDHAYRYDGPDHYRLPEDTDRIPFRF